MKSPWLSVLMPTYNGQDFLSEALDSILIQQDPEIECIVVDDGSSDRTGEILESYANKMPLAFTRREHSAGWAANVNKALLTAKGDYCCVLHQDDLWMDGRLFVLKSIIDQQHDANLILHPSWFINNNGRRLGLWRCPLPVYPVVINANLALERLLIQNFISMPAAIFKRKLALEVDGMDEKLWYTSDWDFWLKMASFGRILYYPKPLSAFRVHAVSQTILRSSSTFVLRGELEIVLQRHLGDANNRQKFKQNVVKTSVFSKEVNIALACLAHRKKADLFRLLRLFFLIGPGGWQRYFRDSRIFERVTARLRAGILRVIQ